MSMTVQHVLITLATTSTTQHILCCVRVNTICSVNLLTVVTKAVLVMLILALLRCQGLLSVQFDGNIFYLLDRRIPPISRSRDALTFCRLEFHPEFSILGIRSMFLYLVAPILLLSITFPMVIIHILSLKS